MQDFNYLDGEYNLGGLTSLKFAPVENVSSIPDPQNDGVTLSAAIVLTGIADWYHMYATTDSIELSYEQETTEHGESVNVFIKAFIPKLKPDHDQNFNELMRRGFVILATDSNGYERVIGSKEVPATFNFSSGTGVATASRNGTSVSFTWQADHVPYYVD